MSNEYDIGAPAPAPLTPNEARGIAENLAAAGVPPEGVRQHLKSRGFDPDKAIGPADEAQWQLDSLKADSSWVAKLNAGDSEANGLLSSLTAKIAMGQKFSPLPEVAKPEDYRFDVRRIEDNDLAGKFQSESARFAADLKLPTNAAAAVIDGVLDNVGRTALMAPDQKAQRGEVQLEQLRSVLGKNGADADARLAQAEKTLKQHSGRDIPLADIARTSGANVALELVLHADALAYRASR